MSWKDVGQRSKSRKIAHDITNPRHTAGPSASLGLLMSRTVLYNKSPQTGLKWLYEYVESVDPKDCNQYNQSADRTVWLAPGRSLCEPARNFLDPSKGEHSNDNTDGAADDERSPSSPAATGAITQDSDQWLHYNPTQRSRNPNKCGQRFRQAKRYEERLSKTSKLGEERSCDGLAMETLLTDPLDKMTDHTTCKLHLLSVIIHIHTLKSKIAHPPTPQVKATTWRRVTGGSGPLSSTNNVAWGPTAL